MVLTATVKKISKILSRQSGSQKSTVSFQGVYTAIVTPFSKSGEVDYLAFEKLVKNQIAAGVAGIVINGTTGESPTLFGDEVESLVKKALKLAKGTSCQIIVGTGTNSTEKSARRSKKAASWGVHGVLVVNPYYNKPTQQGLYLHFKTIADAVPNCPIILYNIKGRTGVNLETSTLLRLVSECKSIKAVKEASGDVNQMKEIIAKIPAGFSVLSGDDGLTFELMKMGGHGVVSVASNLIPEKMVTAMNLMISKNWDAAKKIDDELQPVYASMFYETNPIPIKAALAKKGLISEVYRLPMCEMGSENKQKMITVLQKAKIL